MAVANQELLFHYQPQVDLRSGKICAMEALVRWNHPQRGLLFPGQFIAVAEESGLIAEMGVWAVHEACRQCAASSRHSTGSNPSARGTTFSPACMT